MEVTFSKLTELPGSSNSNGEGAGNNASEPALPPIEINNSLLCGFVHCMEHDEKDGYSAQIRERVEGFIKGSIPDLLEVGDDQFILQMCPVIMGSKSETMRAQFANSDRPIYNLGTALGAVLYYATRSAIVKEDQANGYEQFDAYLLLKNKEAKEAKEAKKAKKAENERKKDQVEVVVE